MFVCGHSLVGVGEVVNQKRMVAHPADYFAFTLPASFILCDLWLKTTISLSTSGNHAMYAFCEFLAVLRVIVRL